MAHQRARTANSVLRLNIRGRGIPLRGLHRPPRGALRWLALLGPGLVAAAAGDDAGGIATYSAAGAQFGYELLWVLVLITISLAVVQEMAARLGAATGRGLLDLIRESFGVGWAMLAVVTILIANGGLVASEFLAVGAAAELIGTSKYVAIPLAAALVWYLVVAGGYRRVETVFLAMTLVFFAYPVAAIWAHPDWGAVARGTFIPSLQASPDFIMLTLALIGTTLTPYMQLFQQSAVVEKGIARRHYRSERIDTFVGVIFSDVISAFIMIATAATLFTAGEHEIGSAADAARALQPFLGDAAQALFAVGILGASLLAAAVLPLATAYGVSEAFGFRKGINLDFRRAPVFLGLFSAMVVIGALLALIPGLPVIQVLVAIQVLNGVLLPIMLLFILRLANDRRLMRELKNGRTANVLGWGTLAIVTLAVAAYLVSQGLGLAGISLFGGA